MISTEIQKRFDSGKIITKDEYFTLRLNWYERNLLIPLYSHEVLIGIIENAQKHCSYNNNWPTYENVLINKALPELLKRFKDFAT